MNLMIELPCTATELETRLHGFCDHYGWDKTVRIKKAETGKEFMEITDMTKADLESCRCMATTATPAITTTTASA